MAVLSAHALYFSNNKKEYHKMKALIIGAAGFVGSYLIQHLKDDLHWEVIATKLPQETITIEDIEIYNLARPNRRG